MRAPEFGANPVALYRAAIDQCEWADNIGFDVVGIGEHHASDDGYLPSPVAFAGAVAARTRRIAIRPSVLLAPLYDPIKLAEDLAVLQLLSGGRLVVAIGAGYRPVEFEMFGKRREDRKALYINAIAVLKQAWTGQPFEYNGRVVRVTPVPDPPPPILLGGTHPAVARRAAHIADGYFPPMGENWNVYRDECLMLGKPDPGATFKSLGPIFTYVTKDPDSAWERLTPHILHAVQSYADWTTESYGHAAGPFAAGVNIEDLRNSGAYHIATPEQTIELAQSLGPDRTFILTPLLSGLDPGYAWQSLHLFEREVWPHIKDI